MRVERLSTELLGHCKASDELTADLNILCSPDGRLIYRARGSYLHVLRVETTPYGPALRQQAEIEAQDRIQAIACGSDGRLYLAVEDREGSLLQLLRGERLSDVAKLPCAPRHLSVVGQNLAAVLEDGPGVVARLIAIDRRSGRTIAEAPIVGEVSRLRPAGNDHVVLADRASRMVSRVALSRTCPPGSEDRPRQPDPHEPSTPDRRCDPPEHTSCCGGKVVRPENTVDPHDPESRRPPRRQPPEYCRPGDDGIDDGCWFTVVIADRLIRINLCDPDAESCTRSIFSRIERLERVGRGLLALTEGGRALVEIDPVSLAAVDRIHLRDRVDFIMPAEAAGIAYAVTNDGSFLAQVEVPSAQAGASAQLTLTGGQSEKVVEGSSLAIPEPGPVLAVGPMNLLIVPVQDPAQDYEEDDLVDFKSVMGDIFVLGEDAPLRIIQRYYDEQSNGAQQINFEIFGADTPAWHEGEPLPLLNEVRSYYYPSFAPGGLRMTPSLGSLPAEYGFTGAERRTISVVSAVNITATELNATEFELVFPAYILTFELGSGLTVSIGTGAAGPQIDYRDRSGTPRSILLDPSVLGSNQAIDFDASMADLGPSLESLRDALQTILSSADTAGDFDAVEVRWVKTGSSLGQINILFSFAPGSGTDVPRINSFGSALDALLGLPANSITRLQGFGLFPAPSGGIDGHSDEIAAYLKQVMLLAEAAASSTGYVPERMLGDANVVAADDGGDLDLSVQLNISLLHGGGGVAHIVAGGGSGDDPLGMAQGQPILGSDFTYDQRNLLIDKEAYFGEIYGAMIAAIDAHTGGSPEGGGWNGVVNHLGSYDTIFVVPIAPPPPSSPGLWTVQEAIETDGLRASVNSGMTISDPNGIAPAVGARWGVQYQNFDSRIGGNTRTFAHEIGHSLGLSDQYFSDKFHPALKYLGGLDLMGSSAADWPHFCAYHKLALGWFDAADRIVIDQPAAAVTTSRRVILVPVEWWDTALQSDFEDAFPAEPGSTEATGAVLCDLGGDGGVLAVIEARSPGEEFSAEMARPGNAGRVTITNVLDYGTKGRYGQVLPDAEGVPDDVVKGLLRYRRRIHEVERHLQVDPNPYDMANAPGFPVPGLTVEVVQEESVTVDGTAVPAYLCEIVWELGPNADVGFSDNEKEWRSSDIGIDYVGTFGAQAGTTDWPVGQPSHVGDDVIIPGSGEEPHEVMVRVWNFGNTTAHNVEVELFLRDPGGGGDPDRHGLYDTHTIAEVPPEAESGPVEIRFGWNVPAGQEPHVCWRTQIARFELGEGAAAIPVSSDARISNNWAQQNIFETDVVYSSPPDPIETRFSVHNDGAFIERTYLEPRGMPRGVRMRIRPREMTVPPFSSRHFQIRLEFDEEIIDDPCRRDMDILVQCWRHEDHFEEPWGASLFKLKVRRKTETSVAGSWLGGLVGSLSLNGQVEPGDALGKVALHLDFQNGEPARWVETPLSIGGLFDEVIDTTDIQHDDVVVVTATYQGSPIHAVSTSEPTSIHAQQPAG